MRKIIDCKKFKDGDFNVIRNKKGYILWLGEVIKNNPEMKSIFAQGLIFNLEYLNFKRAKDLLKLPEENFQPAGKMAYPYNAYIKNIDNEIDYVLSKKEQEIIGKLILALRLKKEGGQ